MGADVEPGRGSDPVERVRPALRVFCGRAAQHPLGAHPRDPGAAGRLEPLPRLDGQEHRDRAEALDRGDRDGETVRELPARHVHLGRYSGTNQPTVRFFSRKIDSAAARTSSAVTAATRSCHSATDRAAPVASS